MPYICCAAQSEGVEQGCCQWPGSLRPCAIAKREGEGLIPPTESAQSRAHEGALRYLEHRLSDGPSEDSERGRMGADRGGGKKTLKRHLAGRRIVYVPPSGGTAADGIGTGHLLTISSPAEGIFASQREVKAFVELRAPFELPRLALSPSKEVLS